MATGTVKKHIGIYNDESEFKKDIADKILVSPYVAYLREGTGYRLYHSSDSNLERCETDAIQDIDNKFSKLELGELKEGADIQVTPIGSDSQSNAKYSSDVFYCTYED